MQQENVPNLVDVKSGAGYGNMGLSVLAFILLVNLAIVFLSGIFFLESFAPGNIKRGFQSIQIFIALYIIGASVLGLLMRGKMGLHLTASVFFFVLGLFMIEIWPNFPKELFICSAVPIAALALMHTSHFKKFYNIQPGQSVFQEHLQALVDGFIVAALFPYAMGW